MKLTYLLLITLGLSTSAYSQGQVSFANTFSTLVSSQAHFTDGEFRSGPTPAQAGLFYFGLFWAPTGVTDPNMFTFTGAYATNQNAAGRFRGGIGNSGPAIAGAAAGSSVNLLVRGWSSNLPCDWATVSSALSPINSDLPYGGFFYGESSIATVVLGGGIVPIPNLFGSFSGQVPGFMMNHSWLEPAPVSMKIYVAPEPGTGALSLAGMAVFAFSRRFLNRV